MIEKFLKYNKIIQWIIKNRFEAILLAIILLFGAFFRLYRIDEYMTFLGDEGRDVIVVRRLLVNFDPILVGPGTSIGNMYLGPLYYYMMAPFLLLANFSPVGPAVMIALLGVVTIFFVWWVAREWFAANSNHGRLAAFIAALFYAVSPVVINYSKSSWNPNIMPFFSLLSVYSIWRVYRFNEMNWLIVLGIAFAFVLQSHYLGLLLIPTLIFYWLISFTRSVKSNVKTEKSKVSGFIKNSIIGSALFLTLMSPLVIFDARHDWRNFTAMKKFFIERQTTVSARPWAALPNIPEISHEAVTRLVTGTNREAGFITLAFFTLGTMWVVTMIYIIRTKTKSLLDKSHSAFLLLFSWIGLALIGLGAYKQEIYDHYYGFFFPAPFILLGGLSQKIVETKKIFGGFIVLVIVSYLLIVNLQNNPLKFPPNRQLQRTVDVAKKISEEVNGKNFNLAVIAERNYEGAYQYFLEKWNEPIVMIDPQRADDTITEQLFVVCELPPEKCDPTHSDKAEIANFGWSKVEGEWKVDGTTLYKLVHSL